MKNSNNAGDVFHYVAETGGPLLRYIIAIKLSCCTCILSSRKRKKHAV